MRYLQPVTRPGRQSYLALAVTCTLLATVAPMAPVSADTVNARFPREARSSHNTYMRLFPDLPAFAPRDDLSRRSAAQLGARGGLMDPQDNLSDPLLSIIDPTFSPNNPDNPDMTAGITFVGQFLDHDITFDRRSELNTNANPNRTLNFRSAAFDLDHVYGRGPVEQPELYEQDGTTIKFRVDEIAGSAAVARGDGNRFDLPRDAFNEAIIADSRNDENVIIAQFHLAMLRFHNAVTDHLLSQGTGSALTPLQLFDRARQQVQWHYQWIVMHEFLPATIGAQRLNTIVSEGTKVL